MVNGAPPTIEWSLSGSHSPFTTPNLPVEAIKNFDEDAAIFNIQNNYDGSNAGATHINTNNNNCTIKYEDRWLEAIEEIKKLNKALLKEKDEKIRLLEKMMGKKKK